MPLIIITGLPCSGKTYRASQILADFQSRVSVSPNFTVQHLSSSHASLDTSSTTLQNGFQPDVSNDNPRDSIYNSARQEKIARGEEMSMTKRALNKNNIVIADFPNYIKGLRYQMWCEAKAVATRSVVVHVASREDECEIWNTDRIKAHGWNRMLEEKDAIDGTGVVSKVGKDVQGDLQPESHTAIYGDRIRVDTNGNGTRSRSSSMGGLSDDGTASHSKLAKDTMTLKSLYISDKTTFADSIEGEAENGSPAQPTSGSSQERQFAQPSTKTPASTPAPSSPPAPTMSRPYSPSTLKSLCMRYEPPSPFTRWDTPLFTIPSSDIHPPYQQIWDAILPPPVKPTKKAASQARPNEKFETKPEDVRRHAATVLPKANSSEALQVLESTTAEVVKAILAAARSHGSADGEGGHVKFSISDPKSSSGSDIDCEVDVPLNTILSQPSLQRLRRAYTQIQRGGIAHGQGHVSGRAAIVADFTKYLETQWNVD